MKLKKFKELLERHGADLRRWPEAERFAARAILEREPVAARLLEGAKPLDGLLDTLEASQAEQSLATLADGIAGLARRTVQTPMATGGTTLGSNPDDRWMLKLLVPQVAGLAAAVLLGIFVGWTDIMPLMPPGQAAESATGTVDLSDLVFGGQEGLEITP